MNLTNEEYDLVVDACNDFNALMKEYQKMTRLLGQKLSVLSFASNINHVRRLNECCEIFEKCIGKEWHKKL